MIASKLAMKIQWSKLFFKTVIWLGTELALTCLGLDDLADYTEFVFQTRNGLTVPVVTSQVTTLV